MFTRRLSVRCGVLAVVVVVSLAICSRADGQIRFEVSPALGVYVPTGELPLRPAPCPAFFVGPQTPSYCPRDSEVPLPQGTQQARVSIGGRATAWLGARGGIQTSIWYAPSGISGEYLDSPGKIFIGTLQLVANLAPKKSNMLVLLMAGPAVVHRSGDAYADVGGTTSPAAVVGFGLEVPPARHLGLRLQFEDYLYTVSFTDMSGKYETGGSESQQDFVLSLSLSPFGGGR
jgi:hypothetical protein